MGLPEEQIESSIRVSWGADTDLNKLQEEFEKLKKIDDYEWQIVLQDGRKLLMDDILAMYGVSGGSGTLARI